MPRREVRRRGLSDIAAPRRHVETSGVPHTRRASEFARRARSVPALRFAESAVEGGKPIPLGDRRPPQARPLTMALRPTPVIEQDNRQAGFTRPRALRSGGSAHPGGQSARPLFQSCFPLRGKSTPVSVSHEADPEWPEPAEHTRQHSDHRNNRSCWNELGSCRRRCPRENRPSGMNSSGKKRTWPPLTTNTITAIARPIASTRINGPPY
jgi:hypothetical protein